MAFINKHDTNGTKGLLAKGELGYDDYSAGGDTGRVYVGTGSVNIPQAKKAEVVAVDGKVDTHVVRVDNPHSVTKTQVGLGSVQNVDTTNASNIASGTLANARLANSGVTAGTYKSVTVDGKGIVTGGTNPTTLSGYGITDATPSLHVGSTGASHGVATTSENGFMSSTDKSKLNNSTSSNTASTIVARDTSGNFSAGTITANLNGTASNASYLNNRADYQFLRQEFAAGETRNYHGKVEVGGGLKIGAWDDIGTPGSYSWKNYLDLSDRLYYKGVGLLRTNEKAADAELFDGKQSTDFMQVGYCEPDLNNMKTAGSFRVESGHLNMPSGVAYGNMLVLKISTSNTITQIVTDWNSTNIYWRSGTDISFQPWKRILSDGNALTTAPLGYASGVGGVVVQDTNKNMPVVLNKLCGDITMYNSALAPGQVVYFKFINSFIGMGDMVDVSFVASGIDNTKYYCFNTPEINGGFTYIVIKNVSTETLAESLRLRFSIRKGAIS